MFSFLCGILSHEKQSVRMNRITNGTKIKGDYRGKTKVNAMVSGKKVTVKTSTSTAS